MFGVEIIWIASRVVGLVIVGRESEQGRMGCSSYKEGFTLTSKIASRFDCSANSSRRSDRFISLPSPNSGILWALVSDSGVGKRLSHHCER